MVTRQAALAELSFKFLVNGFRNAHGPNTLFGEGAKMLMRKEKVLNLGSGGAMPSALSQTCLYLAAS